MKKQETEVRKLVIKMRVNKSEVDRIKMFHSQSTEKSLSNYIRKVTLQKPVLVKYRNQSADDFLTQMIELKKELNAVGNNLNQAVHKLHMLDSIPEFRLWVRYYKGLHEGVAAKVDQINSKVNQLYEQWLLK